MNSPDNLEKFFEAVKNNKIDVVKELVNNKKVDVNYKFPDYELKTAAHIASTSRDLTMLTVLVEELSAKIDIADTYEQLPIENAACHTNYAAIKYLLSKDKSQADKVENHINPPEVDEFFEAINSNNIKKVKAMLAGGTVTVDVPNKSDHYNTALHTACGNKHLELVKVLVDEHKADLIAENTAEEMPVHFTDHDEITQFLVSRGSDDLD